MAFDGWTDRIGSSIVSAAPSSVISSALGLKDGEQVAEGLEVLHDLDMGDGTKDATMPHTSEKPKGPEAVANAPRTLKAIRQLAEEEYQTLDLSGVSKVRFIAMRRTLLLTKYTRQLVNYCRYHEGLVGPLTLFGDTKRVGERGLLKHTAKIARQASMTTGGTISRLGTIIASNQQTTVSNILFHFLNDILCN